MALDSYAGLATYDVTATNYVDLSDLLAALLEIDTNIMGKIKTGPELVNVSFSWPEDTLAPRQVTQASGSALDAGGSVTTINVTTGTGKYVRVGALLKDTAAGKSEVLQVTAISTDELTVTRGYGSTSAELHSATATFRIVAMPKQEGADVSSDISKARSTASNYAMIFERGIQISGSASKARIQAGVPDELAYQTTLRTIELKNEMADAVINSIMSGAGSDTVYRTWKGLIEFLSAGNLNSDAESLDDGVLNAMVRLVDDDGGMPDLFVAHRNQIKHIIDLAKDQVRYAPSDKVRGNYANKFLTELGYEIDLLACRWMPTDVAMVLDTSRILLRPYRNLFMQPVASTGDAVKRQILAEMGLQVGNATQAHAIHTNLVTA